MITFDNVGIGYHGKPLLPPLSFRVDRGERFGLIGPNGAGKSTLLKTLLGILKPVGGEVRFEEGRRPRIGYVPQRDAIETVLPVSVAEVVTLGLGGANGDGIDPHEAVDQAMRRLGISHLAKVPYRDLSGGQKQRTLIARAIVHRPELLIFDEPTNGMDLPSERATLELINDLRDEMKCTTMVVTHLVAAVAPYLDRVAFIDKDKHLFDVGPAADMFAAGPMTRLYGQLVRVTRMEHCIAFDLG